MSDPKLITTHFEQLGGLNEKSSRYLTGLMEFVSFINFDLSVPGAITKRPGSTQYGATVGAVVAPVQGLHEFALNSGSSMIIAGKGTAIQALRLGSTFVDIISGNSSQVDIVTYGDRAWIANGQTYVKFNGFTAYGVGLPTRQVGWDCQGQGLSSGHHLHQQYVIGYVNERGFHGPAISHVAPIFDPNSGSTYGDGGFWGGFSQVVMSENTGLTLGPSYAPYGITSLALYRKEDVLTYGPQGLSSLSTGGLTALWRYGQPSNRYGTYNFHSYFAPAFGFTVADTFSTYAESRVDVERTLEYVPELGSAVWQKQFWLFGSSSMGGRSKIPRYLEIFKNSMFMAGFSLAPSEVWFSELGDPEDVKPDYFFEVRTNDGDRVTAQKAVGTELLLFKENSFHKVVGDSPDNYELIELSTELGCLSNKAVVTVGPRCFFLDAKGIVEYNGSSWDVISARMEPTFRRMNLAAARDNAVAAHYDFKNQIWFGIPVDGSTVNNLVVVYDYKADAWMKYEGINPASLMRAKDAGLGTKTILMGDYSGMVHYFGPSFMGDNGRGISLIAQPRWMLPQGSNAEAEFRRLWLDVETISAGATHANAKITVEVRKNFGTSGITSWSVYPDQFQTRHEFGVQAKALGIIFSHYSATHFCQINGFHLAHRVLRDV